MNNNTNEVRHYRSFPGTTVVRGYNGEETNFFDWGSTNNVTPLPDWYRQRHSESLLAYRQRTVVPPQTDNIGIETVLKTKVGQCSICQEDLNEGEAIRILDCMHKYHKKCVDRWLSQHSNSCPECRHQSKVA